EEPPRERLVDHAHRPSAQTILFRDLASQQHRDPESGEIRGPERIVPGSAVAASTPGVTLDRDLIAVLLPTEQAVVRIRGGADAWDGADAREHLLERLRLTYDVVPRGLHIHAHGQDALFRISEIDALQIE